jgi:hypothetical protein
VLKLRQLRGWEWEYLVKWKGFHPIVASWWMSQMKLQVK